MNAAHCLKPLGVRQPKVNQCDVRTVARDVFERLFHGLAMENLRLEIGNLSKGFLYQSLIARIIFHQQNLSYRY